MVGPIIQALPELGQNPLDAKQAHIGGVWQVPGSIILGDPRGGDGRGQAADDPFHGPQGLGQGADGVVQPVVEAPLAEVTVLAKAIWAPAVDVTLLQQLRLLGLATPAQVARAARITPCSAKARDRCGSAARWPSTAVRWVARSASPSAALCQRRSTARRLATSSGSSGPVHPTAHLPGPDNCPDRRRSGKASRAPTGIAVPPDPAHQPGLVTA